MSWEENKEFTESKPQYQPDPPLWKKTWKYIVVGVLCFIIGFSISSGRAKYFRERNQTLTTENHELKKSLRNQQSDTPVVSSPVPVATASVKPSKEAAPATKEAAPTTDAPAEELTDNTYDNNQYYDVVETSTFKNSINYTILVHKVLAKKDVRVTGTILAYAEDGSVIGKSSDDIVLTAGQYNYFRYSFENDISSANLQMNAQAKEDTILVGERNAVEMVSYNQSGSSLFITFKQNVDDLGLFPKFKLLFYKDDRIVDTEDGYFDVYAENMNCKDATDVAEIPVYNLDFDRFEYIYEP